MSELDLGNVMGPHGAAASVRIGNVTTLPPGSSATVTNSGNIHDAVLDFGIPEGDTGDGSGDMLKNVYDADGDGVVDDAAKLGGKLPGAYALLPATFTAGHIPLIGTDGNFTDSGQALDDLGGITAAVEAALNLHKEDASNPHKVTAEQIAAAPVTHTHAASDIIDILPITLGGTGAATAAEALVNLGAASSDHTHANMLVGTYGTSDLTAGSSSLPTGTLYFMYT